ncbi:TIGR02391 family protein [Mycolicibacterium rhodesiae]|nr:TIGR02391 family protein [Mycolicibacterium rhodesiae]
MRGKMMKLRRVLGEGEVHEADIEAMDLGPKDGITFRVDADVEDGDEVTDTLPNGKTKTMRLHDVHVLQSPFGDNLDHTGAKYTVIPARAVPSTPTPVTLPGLHPLISQASGSQVAVRHFDDAVSSACQAVEDRVQALTGYPKNNKNAPLSGKPLMSLVFSPQAPMLDITSDNVGEVQKADEVEGYMYLFMGVAQALRNPRSHGPRLRTSEPEAMEMLATASLLMRALDRAESRLPQPRHKPPMQQLPRGIGSASARAARPKR